MIHAVHAQTRLSYKDHCHKKSSSEHQDCSLIKMCAYQHFLIVIVLTVTCTQPQELRPLLKCGSSTAAIATYGEWECGDGYCIFPSLVCDGYYDCLNGSDELNCSICRGKSFSCKNNSKLCISKHSYCDGVKDCKDGSDEPDRCILNTLDTIRKVALGLQDLYSIVDPKNTFGPVFGGIIGIILLFFTILVLVAVVIALCICNKRCPIYKWRQRRGQPPIGVILATDVPNEATSTLSQEDDDSVYNIGTDTTERRSLI